MKECSLICKNWGGSRISERKFIVDHNVGKLTRWLWIMGYDTLFFNDENDSGMVAQTYADGRIILTKDTEIMQRRVITYGHLNAILIKSEEPERQINQVINELDLDCRFKSFSLCLECNQSPKVVCKEKVEDMVPTHVVQTQSEYMQCPACHRIYWKGTHWEVMNRKLDRLMGETTNKQGLKKVF